MSYGSVQGLYRQARSWLPALAIALSAVGSVQAGVVYKGSWDPKYGDPFDTGSLLGWRGSFEIDDVQAAKCGAFTVAGTVSCTGAAMFSAKVEFYDWESGLTDAQLQALPTIASITYTALPSLNSLLYNSAGKVVGLDTGIFSYESPTPDLADGYTNPFVDVKFALDFDIFLSASETLPDMISLPRLYWQGQNKGCSPSGNANPCAGSGRNDPAFDADLYRTFQITDLSSSVFPVPEPGALSLALGALAAAFAAGRRRRAR
mgnify:CR=1 FL=1